MSDWHDINASCVNCSKPLRARWANHFRSFVLSGASPVDIEHADGTTECIIRRTPACYDIFTANRELIAAEQKALEAEDGEE